MSRAKCLVRFLVIGGVAVGLVVATHRPVSPLQTDGAIENAERTERREPSDVGWTGTEPWILAARGLAANRSGGLLIADISSHRVWRMASEGMFDAVAGRGSGGRDFGTSDGDGGPATRAGLNWPIAVTSDGEGAFFVAEFHGHRVRKVGPDGRIVTAVGTGIQGCSGDGGLATKARIGGPHGLAVDRAGNLYIADFLNGRIRKVDESGMITTVAGGGKSGGEQRVLATESVLTTPVAIIINSRGEMIIAEQNAHRIRRVGTNGMISTLAGTGKAGFSGDGGRATAAQLHSPVGLAVDTRDHVFIADLGNACVREVRPDGMIRTVVGGGSSTDKGPQVAAMRSAHGVAVNEDGSLFIADNNTRIWRIKGVASPGLLVGGPPPASEESPDEAKEQAP
jgi:sugar lactone lactonase YvrE